MQQKKQNGWQIKSILVTNTRFSDRAVKYSQCVGVDLWGWKHPLDNGLESVIDRGKLYPITILPAFQRSWAEVFGAKNLFLAKDVLNLDINKFSAENRIPLNGLRLLMDEARMLLAPVS